MIKYFYKKFVRIFVLDRLLNKNHENLEKIVQERIIFHQGKMSDFLGVGIRFLSMLYLFIYIPKKILSFEKKDSVISNSRNSKLSFIRKLIRLHDSLFELAISSEKLVTFNTPNFKKVDNRVFDYIVIGSGPGGSVAAKELQKAGFLVSVLERGWRKSPGSIPSYSYSEMLNSYKHGGISATLGNANIAYVEGSLFGGGSEVNSGLYHRTPEDIVNSWVKEFKLDAPDHQKYEKIYRIIENELKVSQFPKRAISKASLKLKAGADELNWSVQEVPRWFRYTNSNTGKGEKMTMMRTYLKDYINNGGHFQEQVSAKKIKKEGKSWSVFLESPLGKSKMKSKNIVLSSGAIDTPLLLKRSGLSKKAGNKFQMHPTIKVVALFDEKVNSYNMGVPVHQVKEFSPEISFGCSISSKPYLRAAMLDHFNNIGTVEEKWEYMAIYYAMIVPQGFGSIYSIPYYTHPLVTYNLTKEDKINLARGLKNLCKLLIHSGSIKLFPSIINSPIISNIAELKNLPEIIDPNISSLMTVHLFSSCPIGVDRSKCVANSYGKLFGENNIYISDGSMLPSAPGVNPQGSIMALAHRNIEKIISEAL